MEALVSGEGGQPIYVRASAWMKVHGGRIFYCAWSD
ncbi:hypothetical protein OROGR_009791 [Orobanche gracilis]